MFDSIVCESDNKILSAILFCSVCFILFPITIVIDLAKYKEIPLPAKAIITKTGMKSA